MIILKKELETLIPANTLKALYLCSQAAETSGLKIYLIGGAVRDVIIGKNHFDTDITVEGNSVEFAQFLEKNLPKVCKIKEIHEKFGTAKIIFCIDEEKIEIDLASTRKESYPYPASLPQVEEIGCSLYEDVTRRDFSINSMALSLNQNTFGELTDYLGGYDDLKNKIIRILHEKSFIDDPTRIIRALKFRVRFDCKPDKTTQELQKELLESGKFDNLCGERIKSELKQTFNLNNPEALQIFINESIYRLVDTDIKSHSDFCITDEYLSFINPDFIWLVYLSMLFSGFSQDKISEIAQKLYLSNEESDILTESKILLEKSALFERTSTNFEIYEFFEGFSTESVLCFLLKKSEFKEKADFYLNKLKNVKIYTNGNDLINLGLKPGVIFGEILRELLKAKINQNLSTKEDEKEFLKDIIKKRQT